MQDCFIIPELYLPQDMMSSRRKQPDDGLCFGPKLLQKHLPPLEEFPGAGNAISYKFPGLAEK